MSRLPVVSVRWTDAHSVDEWTMADDLPKTGKECVSVGFLVRKTKACLTVAGTGSEDGDVCCTIIIPKAWVRGIKYLKEKGK